MWVEFVFVKQKTAYEMRISDWSSDVCSSDLAGELRTARQHDVERLVEDDLAAAGEGLALELRVDRDAHLATAGVDVDGAVLVVAEEGAVRRRRLEIGRAPCRERVCKYV